MKARPAPWLATSSIGLFSLKDMKPRTEKMTKPEKIAVKYVTTQMNHVSWKEKMAIKNMTTQMNWKERMDIKHAPRRQTTYPGKKR